MARTMARRTIYLPESVEALARLIESGARSGGESTMLSYIGSGEGPEDLGLNAEKYLRESLG